MSLIQPVKFRTWETGLFKMCHFETPHFGMGVFETEVMHTDRLEVDVSQA